LGGHLEPHPPDPLPLVREGREDIRRGANAPLRLPRVEKYRGKASLSQRALKRDFVPLTNPPLSFEGEGD